MRRALIPVVLLASVLAACGSDGGSSGSATSTSSTTSPSDPLAADRRLARAALLRAGDLPGFATSKRTAEDDTTIQELAEDIPSCAALVAGKRDGRVRQRSPHFAQGSTSVDEDVAVYSTEAEIGEQLELYRDPSIIGCLDDLFTKAIQERVGTQATIGDVSVSPISVENVGDGQFGFRLTVDVSENGQTQRVLSDLVGVAVGRVGVSFTVDAPDAAALAQVESTVVPLVVQRAQDAGA